MTETPVRLVQSGKTYRQLFDAEVQLMKSLGEKRQKESDKLPDINLNSNRAVGLERSYTGLTAQSLLTSRQKGWKNSTLNDFETENPVQHKQKRTQQLMKLAGNDRNIEINEVQGLPDQIEKSQVQSDIVDRIQQACQRRYDKLLDEMYQEIAGVRITIEPDISAKGRALMSQLHRITKEVAVKFNELCLGEVGEETQLKSLEDLGSIWSEIEEKFEQQKAIVEKHFETFDKLEVTRFSRISEILYKYSGTLKDIAAIPISETRRLIENESMLLNQTALTNRRAYADLRKNLMESLVKRAMENYLDFQQKVNEWKARKKDEIIENFISHMKREDIQNPPEVEEIHSDFLQKQKSITENRLSILNQLKLFKPPVSTKSSVYKWNSTLTKCEKKLENLHVNWIEGIHLKYEEISQACLEFADESKVGFSSVV